MWGLAVSFTSGGGAIPYDAEQSRSGHDGKDRNQCTCRGS